MEKGWCYLEVYFLKWEFEERPDDSRARGKVEKQTQPLTQIKTNFNKNCYH